jgi:hypothetical protein
MDEIPAIISTDALLPGADVESVVIPECPNAFKGDA